MADRKKVGTQNSLFQIHDELRGYIKYEINNYFEQWFMHTCWSLRTEIFTLDVSITAALYVWRTWQIKDKSSGPVGKGDLLI